MSEKNKINESLELLKLKNKVGALEGELKMLKSKRPDEMVPQSPHEHILKIRQALETLKNRISLGRRQPDDQFRLAALEVELGRWLLMMEGQL